MWRNSRSKKPGPFFGKKNGDRAQPSGGKGTQSMVATWESRMGGVEGFLQVEFNRGILRTSQGKEDIGLGQEEVPRGFRAAVTIKRKYQGGR